MASEANLTMEQFQAMEGMIQVTWKAAGDSLRIKFQAMPLGISLMCTGFVQVEELGYRGMARSKDI